MLHDDDDKFLNKQEHQTELRCNINVVWILLLGENDMTMMYQIAYRNILKCKKKVLHMEPRSIDVCTWVSTHLGPSLDSSTRP